MSQNSPSSSGSSTQKPYTFDRVVRMILSAITLVLIFLLLRYLSGVLIPFVIAVILAYLLNPVVTLFHEKTENRAMAVGITVGGGVIFGLAVVVIMVALTMSQVDRFAANIEKLQRGWSERSVQTERAIPSVRSETMHGMSNEVAEPDERTKLGFYELSVAWSRFRENPDNLEQEQLMERFRSDVEGTAMGAAIDEGVKYIKSDSFDAAVQQMLGRLAKGGFTLVSFIVNSLLGIVGLIIILLYLIFLLMDFPAYVAEWESLVPHEYRDPINGFLTEFNNVMQVYFRGQALVALCVGILCAIGFSIVGLPLAVPFGLFVGLLNMVPYLQNIALVPAFLLTAVQAVETEHSLWFCVILVLFVFGIVQLIQDAVLVPRIMGKATGLKPVVILLGIFIWGKLLGFLGLLLAIPLTCLGIAYYRRHVLNEDASPIALESKDVAPTSDVLK